MSAAKGHRPCLSGSDRCSGSKIGSCASLRAMVPHAAQAASYAHARVAAHLRRWTPSEAVLLLRLGAASKPGAAPDRRPARSLRADCARRACAARKRGSQARPASAAHTRRAASWRRPSGARTARERRVLPMAPEGRLCGARFAPTVGERRSPIGCGGGRPHGFPTCSLPPSAASQRVRARYVAGCWRVQLGQSRWGDFARIYVGGTEFVGAAFRVARPNK